MKTRDYYRPSDIEKFFEITETEVVKRIRRGELLAIELSKGSFRVPDFEVWRLVKEAFDERARRITYRPNAFRRRNRSSK